ncbi:MAG TPA: efflux transporter outer membrane subunit [Steroidobacteraceae bacterium]|jgi:NodT family efflux transporter outer membrane factor (OMF) lipoprotein|nr:efflux transporter outer membrane subunit [Steroidobacteraceae bacterium]
MKMHAASGLLALVALSACTVGPEYRQPQMPTPPAYLDAATRTPATPSTPATEAALARWWRLFQDPTLQDLIGQALADNPDLQTAASRVREARLQEIVSHSAEYPNISAALNVATVHTNEGSSSSSGGSSGGSSGSGSGSGGGGGFALPSALNLYAAGFDATWEVDLFGGTRRAVEAARANTEAAIWARRDGEVSLSAEVANDYLTLRGLQARIALEQEQIQRQRDLFTLIRQRRQTGFVTQLNVNQQTGAVENAEAQIPALQAQARGEMHALGVLLGQTPEALEQRLADTAALPPAPPALPPGLPSELLRRRPDVREAERRLAASNAQIGEQLASLYPKFNLIAFPAFANTSIDQLFSSKSLLGAAVGMLTEPLFDAGRRHASVNIAKEETAQAALAYRKTVLGALRDVEDSLSRYRFDQQRHAALARAVAATSNSLSIAQDQYKTGFVTFINVLQSQYTLLSLQDQLTESDAQLLTDLVALYKALGGGWSPGLS